MKKIRFIIFCGIIVTSLVAAYFGGVKDGYKTLYISLSAVIIGLLILCYYLMVKSEEGEDE